MQLSTGELHNLRVNNLTHEENPIIDECTNSKSFELKYQIKYIDLLNYKNII